MYTIFWPRRRWISRSNVINALKGVVRTRGNRARGVVGIVERLIIIRGLVKKI